MASLKELQEIRDIISDFKSLGANYLVEEENLNAQKLEEALNEAEEKLKLIDLIDEEIEELEVELEENETKEFLDVELIRTKTQLKKLEKRLAGSNEMHTSQMKIDNTENDKIRYQKNLVNLKLMQRLTDMTVDDEGRILMSDGSGSFKVFRVSQNNATDVNSEIVWNRMMESSPYVKEWEALLNKN